MSKYSGNTSFRFSIERYKDKNTGELLTTNNEGFETVVIDLIIHGEYYHDSGNYSGLPEDCYPSESEVIIVSSTDSTGKDWSKDLTDQEEFRIEDIIIDSVRSNQDY